MSIGTYLRNEIAGPLGADFYIGLPAAEEPRVARLVSFLDALARVRCSLAPPASGRQAGPGPGRAGGAGQDVPGPRRAAAQGALGPRRGASPTRRSGTAPALHAAEIPAANGIGDARSLALLYGACVDEVTTPSGEPFRILTPEQVDRAVQQQTEGPDAVLLGLDLQWGLGFNVNTGLIGAGRPRRAARVRALRHGGLGGMGRPRPRTWAWDTS